MVPQSKQAVSLENEIKFIDYPTNTYFVDPLTQHIVGECDGLVAISQAIQIILQTERYKFQIHSSNAGIEIENLIGMPAEYVIAELKRRVEDALSVDNRILNVKDFKFERKGKEILCEFVVNTVFGKVVKELSFEL